MSVRYVERDVAQDEMERMISNFSNYSIGSVQVAAVAAVAAECIVAGRVDLRVSDVPRNPNKSIT